MLAALIGAPSSALPPFIHVVSPQTKQHVTPDPTYPPFTGQNKTKFGLVLARPIAPAQSLFAERLRILLRSILDDEVGVTKYWSSRGVQDTAIAQQNNFATFGGLRVQPAPRLD